MHSTLIGAGEVGRVFLRSTARSVRVVRRADPLELQGDGTVLVAVREEDLASLIDPLRPAANRCAFVQNGLVDEVLAPLGEVTRGLVWFTAKGETFHVLAPTVFHGPRAEDCARWLDEVGVASRVVRDEHEFRREVARKLAWNNVAGLGPFVRGVTLGEYIEHHREEVRGVIDETLRVCAARDGVSANTDETLAMVLATTVPLAALRGGNKALSFRNGAVQRWGRLLGIETPIQDGLLALTGPSK